MRVLLAAEWSDAMRAIRDKHWRARVRSLLLRWKTHAVDWQSGDMFAGRAGLYPESPVCARQRWGVCVCACSLANVYMMAFIYDVENNPLNVTHTHKRKHVSTSANTLRQDDGGRETDLRLFEAGGGDINIYMFCLYMRSQQTTSSVKRPFKILEIR